MTLSEDLHRREPLAQIEQAARLLFDAGKIIDRSTF